MAGFAKELKEAKAGGGHRSARAFFLWLKERGVSFNYSYYMQLEQGGLPSEKVVAEIGAALRGAWPDRLALAYCRELFPKQAYLFPAPETAKSGAGPGLSPAPEEARYAPAGQKELSLRQVAVLSAQEHHYRLFLFVTLARRPVPSAELTSFIAEKPLRAAVKALREAGLLREEAQGLVAVSVESRFPPAHGRELEEAYRKFDQWDDASGASAGLEPVLNKLLLRRVSGRYLGIISRHLETVFDIVKSSDETDPRFNEQVLQLKVTLRHGKLPG